MDTDNIISLTKSGKNFSDELTSILRNGAQKLLLQAVEEEVQSFLSQHTDKRLDDGRAQVIRNGYLPERHLQTGIGPIAVKVPRTRDRGSSSDIKFSSALLPPYLKRTKNIDELLPFLYLKGLSSNDFSEALESLLGPQASGLSASSISRLKEQWQVDLDTFQKCDFYPISGMFTSGLMAFIWHPGLSRSNAYWLLLVLMNLVKKNLLLYQEALEKVSYPGRKCYSILKDVV